MHLKMLTEYMAKLERAGLIKHSEDKNGMIQTTEKGKEYLEWFRGLREFR